MIRSMTGFGQADGELPGSRVHIDVKSVNHRFCEVVVRLPRELQSFEEPLKKIVQRAAKRGRFDVFVTTERIADGNRCDVELDWTLVQAYAEAAKQLQRKLGLQGELSVNELLQLPNVISIKEAQADAAETERVLKATLEKAVERLTAMRDIEGRNLAADQEARLDALEESRKAIAVLAPQAVSEYAAKLRERIRDLLQAEVLPDEQRLATEVALMADRSSVDEELTRLDSHIGQFRELLRANEAVGRKLDFLIQEMNREVNTIGSKAAHTNMVKRVIEMKAELEKMREQVQNIE
jgi:uncharacterized protein (TIGR00255 family)